MIKRMIEKTMDLYYVKLYVYNINNNNEFR